MKLREVSPIDAALIRERVLWVLASSWACPPEVFGTRIAITATANKNKPDPRSPVWKPLLTEPGGCVLRTPLAFGAVVCTAVVTDCLPIVEVLPEEPEACIQLD